jgi:Flp pilus assembly protein TadG
MEAALTLPFLIFVLIGMMEMYLYMGISRRVTTAASLTADLISQQTDVAQVGVTGPPNAANLADIFTATNYMLQPFATSGSSLTYTAGQTNPVIYAASINYAVPTVGSNNLTGQTGCSAPNPCTGVDWQYPTPVPSSITGATSTAVYNNFATGCTQNALAACYCTLNPATVGGSNTGAPACLLDQSVIYVQVSYTYSNPLSYFLPALTVMTDTGFLKPRSNATVPMCTTSAPSSCT